MSIPVTEISEALQVLQEAANRIADFPMLESIQSAGGGTWDEIAAITASVSGWIARQTGIAYDYAPALTLGLLVAVSLPVLALIGMLARWRPNSGSQSLSLPAEERMRPLTPLPRQSGWLETVGAPAARFPIGREITRIGRAEDNDVRLSSASIHRYHAVVERSPEMAFTIVDVSGAAGNGIRVGGEPVRSALLHDGDTVELGAEKLRFRLGGPDSGHSVRGS